MRWPNTFRAKHFAGKTLFWPNTLRKHDLLQTLFGPNTTGGYIVTTYRERSNGWDSTWRHCRRMSCACTCIGSHCQQLRTVHSPCNMCCLTSTRSLWPNHTSTRCTTACSLTIDSPRVHIGLVLFSLLFLLFLLPPIFSFFLPLFIAINSCFPLFILILSHFHGFIGLFKFWTSCSLESVMVCIFLQHYPHISAKMNGPSNAN